VIVSASLRTKIRIKMSKSEWLPEFELFQSGVCILFFGGGGDWMKSEVYKRQVDTRDKLLVCILGAPARVKRSEDQLIRTKRDLPTRVAICIEADSGGFSNVYCEM
jgi:hypothetical protein